jgi:formate hydrogenlyase subunit 6/NADH:ubiquinone oxidoreductase subunit I
MGEKMQEYAKSFLTTSSQSIKTIISVLRIKSYALLSLFIALSMATVIPFLTLIITGMWIYNITISTLPVLIETLLSYVLSGLFISLLMYSKREQVNCKGGKCLGITGTTLSVIGCCSPIIYALFFVGVISNVMVPFLTLIPFTSTLMLTIATFLLSNRIRDRIYFNEKKELSDEKVCCDVLGRHLNEDKIWYTARKASGDEWIPAFIKYVNSEKCIGCGLCLKVCIGECYEMRDIKPKEIKVSVNGRIRTFKVNRQAFVINQDNCYGDCHCHKICPVDGGAMVCEPKLFKDLIKMRF